MEVVVNLDTGVFVFEFDIPQIVTKKKVPFSHKMHSESKCKSGKQLVLPSIITPTKVSSNSSRSTKKFYLESCSNVFCNDRNTDARPKYHKDFPSFRRLYHCCKGTKISPDDDDGDELRIIDFQSMTQKEKRLKSLDKRCSTLPKIRDRSSYVTKESVLLMALHKFPKNATQFPSQSSSFYSENTSHSHSPH